MIKTATRTSGKMRRVKADGGCTGPIPCGTNMITDITTNMMTIDQTPHTTLICDPFIFSDVIIFSMGDKCN